MFVGRGLPSRFARPLTALIPPLLPFPSHISDILSLQDPITGAFAGDASRLEYDTRFLYCAVSALSLLTSTGSSGSGSGPAAALGQDPLSRLDVDKTVAAVLACHNFDGGFGTDQGAESHASQAFVSVGALRILNALDSLGTDGMQRLGEWLSERQLPNGGLNGRPQKLEDVSEASMVLQGRPHAHVGAGLSLLSGLLFMVGVVRPGNAVQGALDQRRQASTIHPQCTGENSSRQSGVFRTPS